MSQAEARAVLDGVPTPAGGSFEGGTFQVGHPIPGPEAIVDGRLASMSWDYFYLLDDGDRGSWGGAVKVYGSPEEAVAAANAFAVFWSCDGARTVIGDIDAAAYDELMATYCRRAGGDDYVATVSAVSGLVTANLTVSAPTSALAVAELESAWAALDVTARAAQRGTR